MKVSSNGVSEIRTATVFIGSRGIEAPAPIPLHTFKNSCYPRCVTVECVLELLASSCAMARLKKNVQQQILKSAIWELVNSVVQTVTV